MNCVNLPVSSHIMIETALVQEITGLEDGEGEDKVEWRMGKVRTKLNGGWGR